MADPADVLTVVLVDDDAAVRDSLSLLLGLRGYRTVTFASAEDALAAATPSWAGCVVADLKMPGRSGLELAAELDRRGVAMPVVIITAHGDVASAREAFRRNAVDFLEKPFEDEVLIEALGNAVSELGSSAHADVSAIRARFAELTEREREVMAGVVAGLPNKTIAYDLTISPRTVEVHRANVMGKMGARSLPELVRMTLTAGLSL